MNTPQLKIQSEKPSVLLELVSPDGGNTEELQHLAKNLRELLQGTSEVAISPSNRKVETAAALESKSDPVSLTALAMAFLSGGAATALINAIRAVHPGARDSKIKYRLSIDGKKKTVEYGIENLTQEQVTKELQKLNELAKSGFTEDLVARPPSKQPAP